MKPKQQKENNDMNTTTQLKKIHSLVLCHYNTTAPATTALNRTATARTAAAAHAATKVARVYNQILTARGTPIGRAISLQQRTGVAIRRFGLPCDIGGIYLPIRSVSDVQNVYDDAMAELDVIREDIIASYPDQMARLRADLGDFADEVRIPTASEVASRFGMTLTIINQPAAVDGPVLSQLTEEVANRVRADSQRQHAELLKQSHAGPINDLKKVIADFSDALRNAQRLHMTQFDKLRDEARRVQNLNILELPEIDEVVRTVAEAATTPAGELTQPERVRIAQKAEAASALSDNTLAALRL